MLKHGMQVVGRGISAAVVAVLPLVVFGVVGGGLFWLLGRAGVTPVIAGELSVAGALLVLAHGRKRWGREPVDAATQRGRLVVPAACLALAAGSHTLVWRLGIAPDEVVLATGAAVGGCFMALFLLAWAAVGFETMLILAGVRRLGSYTPMQVVVMAIMLLVFGGSYLLHGLVVRLGINSHPVMPILAVLYVVGSVVLPFWRMTHLLNQPQSGERT